MQQVKFKNRSMEGARYGNRPDYYLFSIKGDRAVVKYHEDNRWRSRAVSLSALEVATPLCVLPVDVEALAEEEIRALWLAAGGSFHGPIVATATMPYESMINFIRGLL